MFFDRYRYVLLKSFKYNYNSELANNDIISFHHLESCLFSIANAQKLSSKVGLDNKTGFITNTIFLYFTSM